MKILLLFPALLLTSNLVQAQTTPTIEALQAENRALKEKVLAYEAQLGINSAVSAAITDPAFKVKFQSCTISRANHRGTLLVLLTNTGEPVDMVLSGAGASNLGSGNSTLVVDEQGRALKSGDMYPLVAGNMDHNTVPTNVPVSCTLYLTDVPTDVTQLASATLVFSKTGSNRAHTIVKATLRNMPVKWVP